MLLILNSELVDPYTTGLLQPPTTNMPTVNSLALLEPANTELSTTIMPTVDSPAFVEPSNNCPMWYDGVYTPDFYQFMLQSPDNLIDFYVCQHSPFQERLSTPLQPPLTIPTDTCILWDDSVDFYITDFDIVKD